jgi:hypothetical protein
MMLTEGSKKMVGMFFSNVFDCKIIDDQSEEYWMVRVGPETRRVWHLVVQVSAVLTSSCSWRLGGSFSTLLSREFKKRLTRNSKNFIDQPLSSRW